METIICNHLRKLKTENRIPFHMPGHKRQCFLPEDCSMDIRDLISMDITEIRDYDNLHHPEGIILESMKQLKETYHTKKSWYLVNGSTVGILASISSVCQPGDEIIVARNCHRSVYNAIRLLHLNPLYIYPEYSPEYDMFLDIREEQREELGKLLEDHPGVKAVLITSPTYEGVVSDVAAIKEILSPYGIPLIVDEAHGAHLAFHSAFPKSAVECGADLVIQSVHKTLPCFTQTAILHLCSDLVTGDRIQEMLSVYETSSPSYLLLASAEYGVAYARNHPEKMQEYVDRLVDFRRKCGQLHNIRLFEPQNQSVFACDPGKLVFTVKKIDGGSLFRRLYEGFGIECEMEAGSYCLAMTSVNDTAETFARLEEAVCAIDKELDEDTDKEKEDFSLPDRDRAGIYSLRPQRILPVWEAMDTEKRCIPWEESAGETAAEYIFLYPPGVPVLVPGEKITKETVEKMKEYLYNGYNVPALSEGTVHVVGE